MARPALSVGSIPPWPIQTPVGIGLKIVPDFLGLRLTLHEYMQQGRPAVLDQLPTIGIQTGHTALTVATRINHFSVAHPRTRISLQIHAKS